MKKFVVAILALASATAVQASEADLGHIVDLWVMPNGTILFNHAGTRTGVAPCQPPHLAHRWAVTASASGQNMAAVLLTAYSLRKRIRITGSGACPDHGDTETVLYFQVEPAS